MNKKLCLVNNSAPHYRASIFRLIDKTFDCDYVFGESMGDIKQMDTCLLKGKVTKVKNHYFHSFYWQLGVQKLLERDYNTFILSGDTHYISTWVFALRARLFHPKKSIFFWTHGWYGKESWIEKVIKKLFLRLPNGGIFLYGNYAYNLMIEEGFDKKKLFVIHNSLAYEKQLETRKHLTKQNIYKKHFGNENHNLIFVGRLNPVKRLDEILHALKELGDKGEHYNLTLIGDGSQRETLQLLCNELGLNNYVWFYGACYDEHILGSMIYNADLCVSPGNVGLTAMHVMVFGTPVITHNNFPFQMPEFEAIHEGVTGAFFEYGNVESLAQTIKEWLDAKFDKREEVRMACFKEIDSFWTPQFQLRVLKEHLL